MLNVVAKGKLIIAWTEPRIDNYRGVRLFRRGYTVAFDGANIWVTNYESNNVTKLRASDGTNLGTFPVGTAPIGIAFDGANIWVVNWGSNSVSKL